jgi:hypothetical protein
LPNNTYAHGWIDATVAVISGASLSQPPAVTVSYPSTGESFSCLATVSFNGTVSDPEKGDLARNGSGLLGCSLAGGGRPAG